MYNKELAIEIARGIGKTGIEGAYNSVTCSTAGDYPSMGFSQWEGIGGRGDYLLSWLDGGKRFAGRAYSDLKNAGELQALSNLLGTRQGEVAQNAILAEDCLSKYLPALKDVPGLVNEKCVIYAGMWCPTSHNVVRVFLQNRVARGYDINDLKVMRDLFYKQYAAAADCMYYLRGYQNRAVATYDYVNNLEI